MTSTHTEVRSPEHAPQNATVTSAAADPEVSALVQRATLAHAALMRGDVSHHRALVSASGDDYTLMAPFGGPPTRGAHYSDERWESIGRFFKNGRDSTLELVRAYRSADMIVLAVIERTHVEVGDTPPQDWALRVTLVFRKEQGQWRLAHRHADPLAPGINTEQAAALARGAPA